MIDSGSVAWMIVATALVLFMTPGLAFFYGGLVRGKNVISTIMYSFISMGVVSIVWLLWGYSLAFGTAADEAATGINNLIGNFDFIGFRDVSATEGDGIPDMLFATFQMMFAIITPALITGAFAERFKFSTYLIFLVLWVTFVYVPICHWVWAGDGWILGIGAADFAGGTVVHINAGVAAIAAAYLVGKRRNVERGVEPHNVPFVVLGAAILWIGWFGFNAGSGLAADGVAVNAFLVTNMAAAVAAVTWGIISYVRTGRMTRRWCCQRSGCRPGGDYARGRQRRSDGLARRWPGRRGVLLRRSATPPQIQDRRCTRGVRCTRCGRHLGRNRYGNLCGRRCWAGRRRCESALGQLQSGRRNDWLVADRNRNNPAGVGQDSRPRFACRNR